MRMTKEKKKALWACARCERRKEIADVNADPVVLRVCDYCGVENWVRPVGHAGAGAGTVNQTLTAEQAVVHAEAVAADLENSTGEPEVVEVEAETVEEVIADAVQEQEAEEAEKAAKEAEIARLKAELAELEE